MQMVLTFRSGAQVRVDVDSFGSKKNQIDDQFTGLDWETPGDWTSKLHGFVLGEVVCIHSERDSAETKAVGQ